MFIDQATQKKSLSSSPPKPYRVRIASRPPRILLLPVVTFGILSHLQVTMAHTANNTTGQNPHLLPLELVQRILTRPWQDETHSSACETLIGELTEHEVEVAARTSYVYWVAVTTHPTLVTADIRQRSAMKEARRHFVGEGFDYDRHCCPFGKPWTLEENTN